MVWLIDMEYPNCSKNTVCSIVSHVDKAIQEAVACIIAEDHNPDYNATMARFMLDIVFADGPTADLLRPEIPPRILRCTGCIYTVTHEDEPV